MTLDLRSLEKGISALSRAISEAQSENFMSSLTDNQREVVKAGVIQNFEFTFELCWKFIQRWIQVNKTPEDAEPQTRKELFRFAARYGLVSDPLAWFKYAEARNLTVHMYEKANAEKVYKTAVDFISDAKYLLKSLKEKND